MLRDIAILLCIAQMVLPRNVVSCALFMGSAASDIQCDLLVAEKVRLRCFKGTEPTVAFTPVIQLRLLTTGMLLLSIAIQSS